MEQIYVYSRLSTTLKQNKLSYENNKKKKGKERTAGIFSIFQQFLFR